MWNQISGSIPKEIGNIKSLVLLLLNGNQLSGPLPDELGYLPNLDRIQIDQNQISGPLPKSFANLNKTKHFHMNNNSISGQIPPELSRLPSLVHFLLDNNNLSGYLPEDFYKLPKLLILQLDNNNFSGSSIPASYGNMTKLLKMSLRNCSLQGQVPDLSRIPELGYIDLSWNQLTGTIPQNKLSDNITTIDLSNNKLTGTIPVNFSGLPLLQKLSLSNNSLNGNISSSVWQNVTFNATARLTLDFENNLITNISGVLRPPANVTLKLHGNPVCANANQLNISLFCGSQNAEEKLDTLSNSTTDCRAQSCPTDSFFEYIPTSPIPCSCAAPIRVGYRLKSPGFSDFRPYLSSFDAYISSGLDLILYQTFVDTFAWEEGPRLRMYLKIFPPLNHTQFNTSEIGRIKSMFTGWNIPDSDIFGPYELLNFTLLGPYSSVTVESTNSGLKKGAVVGIVLGAIAAAVTLSAIVSIIILRRRGGYHRGALRKRPLSKAQMKIEGVKGFTFSEMSAATNHFNNQVGQGGYGKVYKGILADGTIVAIKRAQEGSLQGSKEFYTEIELLSRLHHRNLVSLLGYCDEEYEQMLVYEFMSNGTLRDHLSGKIKGTLDFSRRLRIALASAKEAEGVVPGHVSTVVKGTPVNNAYQSGMTFSVIDANMGSYPSECIEKFVSLALRCCKDETDARPSMAEVVRELDIIQKMTPEADSSTPSVSMATDPEKAKSLNPSSSMATEHSLTSVVDVSGSDLLSGAIPSIRPR
ncbi:putative LRR receptor-like serine/threonine-protein kinase [Acorus calamus]|uniref:LRR receptor-like serine/threonine-protein kinase n=1 Tax=Acorus calamus TaxID=4465 RepID=A0AAV9EGZ2_ACOCL|nr:putative LRR receptor-like serine/threonine-protein kinase [Acorus calamus]